MAAPLPVVEALPRVAPRPLLLISGVDSPLERGEMRKFYAAASRPPNANVTLWEVVGARHTEAFAKQPDEYGRRVIDFLERALLQTTP